MAVPADKPVVELLLRRWVRKKGRFQTFAIEFDLVGQIFYAGDNLVVDKLHARGPEPQLMENQDTARRFLLCRDC